VRKIDAMHRSAGLLALALLVPGRAAAAEGGIDLIPNPWVLFLLIAAFAVLIVPMDRLLFRPLFRVLDERAERIQGARARAGELQSEANALLDRYQSEVARTREKAARERRERAAKAREEELAATGEARREAEERLEQARREVDDALDAARRDLRRESEGLARLAAERVLGRALS